MEAAFDRGFAEAGFAGDVFDGLLLVVVAREDVPAFLVKRLDGGVYQVVLFLPFEEVGGAGGGVVARKEAAGEECLIPGGLRASPCLSCSMRCGSSIVPLSREDGDTGEASEDSETGYRGCFFVFPYKNTVCGSLVAGLGKVFYERSI